MGKKGRGSRTVEPLRDLSVVQRIHRMLEDKPRDQTLFTFNVHVGLRASDLLRLDWSSFVAANGKKLLTEFEVEERKTRRTSKWEIPPAAHRQLSLWWALSHHPSEGLLFPSRKGGSVITVASLHGLVNKWCREAGVDGHFGTHTLRKTCGYHFIKSGGSIEALMELFGHSSQAVTKRYLGITNEEVREKVRQLDLLSAPLEIVPKRSKRSTLVLNSSRAPKRTGEVHALAEQLQQLPEDAKRILRELLA